MQFTMENAAKVMSGEKTQARRIVEANDLIDAYTAKRRAPHILIGISADYAKTHGFTAQTVHRAKRLKWKVGGLYAVCPGRGKAAIGRVKITAIRLEHLQDISEQDCAAELGIPYDRLVAYHPPFVDLWQSLYANQPGKRWQDTPLVWVLELEVVK